MDFSWSKTKGMEENVILLEVTPASCDSLVMMYII